MSPHRLIAAALAAALCSVPAAAPAAESVDDILACMAGNLPSADDLHSLRVATTSRAGQERVTHIDLYGRRGEAGSRSLLLRFSQPPELEGASFLIVEEDGARAFYVHTPALDSRRRLEGTDLGGRLFGTDFTYEDIMRYRGMLGAGDLQRLDDVEVGGRGAYALEGRPAPGTSAYSRVVTAVDRERCVLLRIEMYEQEGQPRKVLTTDPETTLFVNAHWIPQNARLEDLRDGSRTDVALRSVVTALEIPDQMFDPASLGQVRPRLAFEAGAPMARVELELVAPELPAP